METEKQANGDYQLSIAHFATLTILVYSVLFIVAVIWIYWQQISPFSYKMPLLWQLLLGFLFALAFVILTLIARKLFLCVYQGEYELRELLGALSLRQIFVVAFFSSVSEEFFFRGALQPCVGIWLASAIFGVLHPPISKNLFFYPFVAAAMGGCFGWMFEVTESLLAPIVAHFTINLVGLYRISNLPEPMNSKRAPESTC